MTYIFSTSNYARSAADWIFQWKQFMKNSIGWTVISSSDGVHAYSLSSDIITSSNSSNGGLANSSAWFVISSPGNNQFCFQRGINNLDWRITYSISGFTAGSPSLTRAPTASNSVFTGLPDQRTLFGAGTEQAPTFMQLFNASRDMAFRCNFMAENSAPYGWYWFGNNPGIYAISGLANVFIFDPMAAGTFPASDLDPYVVYIDGTNNIGSSLFAVNSLPTAYFKKGMPQESSTTVSGYPLFCNGNKSSFIQLVPFGIPQNAFTYQDNVFPVLWARVGNAVYPNGYKGQSSLMQLVGTPRYNYNKISVNSVGDNIVVGTFLLPWNGTQIIA
jgi:hypothetical protein